MTDVMEMAPGTSHDERLAQLFDSMAQGVIYRDRAGRIVLANKSALRLLGLTLDELLALPGAAAGWCVRREDGTPFPVEEFPGLVCLRTGREVRDVIMGFWNRIDGCTRWIQLNSIPLFRDGETTPYEVLTTFDDVTRLKDLEIAVRRTEEQFRIAAECCSDILYEWDLRSSELPSSGSRRPEGPGLHHGVPAEWRQRLHPDERDAVLDAFSAHIESGHMFEREHRLRRDDGEWIHVVTRGRIVRDASGSPLRWIGASSDVTRERKATQRLCDALNLFEAVIEGCSDPIFVKDREGRYLLTNEAAASRFGRAREEVIGKSAMELMPAAAARALVAHDDEVLRDERAITYESDGPAPNGLRRYLVTKAPYRNAAGDVVGVIGIARDLTDVKQLEQEVRQSQKMEAIGRLAGGIAHDFNNLLTVILGYIDEIASEVPDEVGDAVHQVRSAAERAAQLTSQLLAFSRRQVLQPEATNLNDQVIALERMLQRILGEDIALHTTLDPDLGTVMIDRGQFGQVLLNLVVNARDAMPNGGTLTLHTWNVDVNGAESVTGGLAPGRYVGLSVSDTGVGMDSETLSRIFDPFFTTKGRAGTGLGLSTVYGILTQSGGDIRVGSEPGLGSCFTISLPRVADRPAGRDEDAIGSVHAGIGRILLVEDDSATRTLVTTVLQRCGYTVSACRDPLEAMALGAALAGPLDLLLTDVVMPNGNGPALARELCAVRPGLKVLLMSGYVDHAAFDLGQVAAAGPFLQKPFTPAVLAAKVRDVLGNR